MEGESTPLFVPFALQGDILYLAYEALVHQGKPMGGGKKQYFTVLGSGKISPNMLRLTLQSPSPLPENRPGYAWFFALKTLSRLPESKSSSGTQRLSRAAQWGNCLFLWWMKKISAARRAKVLHAINQGARYYTLRRAGKRRPDAPHANLALVDIFLHGSTSGSLWAQSLNAGDIIHSRADYEEHTDHPHQG